MDEQLADLKAALLVGLRVGLQPDQGYQAFERHQLLAIRFHRAARTNATGVSERRGWCQYFEEHFPRGDEYAVLLWERWRNALLKDEYPGPGVVISHGQPHAHWQLVDPGAQLYVDLESMWTDYAQSVDSLIELLERDSERRQAAIKYRVDHHWEVQGYAFAPTHAPVASASVYRPWAWYSCARLAMERTAHCRWKPSSAIAAQMPSRSVLVE